MLLYLKLGSLILRFFAKKIFVGYRERHKTINTVDISFSGITWPEIGMAESLIIGIVTNWNWPYGRSYKPVTLDTRLYVFKEKILIY